MHNFREKTQKKGEQHFREREFVVFIKIKQYIFLERELMVVIRKIKTE